MTTHIGQRYGLGAIVLGLCLLGLWAYPDHRGQRILSAPSGDQGRQQQLTQLLKARYDTAVHLLEIEEKRLNEGVTTLGRVCEVARWVRDSAVELPVPAQERLAALTNFVTLTRRLEEGVRRAAENGAAAPSDTESARYLRLDAEVALLRAAQ